MRRLAYILCCLVVGLLLSSCNVTRHIPSDAYLLQRVRIEEDKDAPRSERVKSDEVTKYLRQKPNKRFLGTDFYAWIYLMANPEKDNWWNNLKRKMGEEPVLFNMRDTERSASNLKLYLDSRGYYSSKVDFAVDTTYRRKRAKVSYSLKQGEPYHIKSVSYDFRDRFLESIILPDTINTLLHKGDIFDISVLEAERERIALYLKDRGYYNFSVNNVEYVADTLGGDRKVGVKVIIKQNLTGYNARGVPMYDNNVVYRLRNVNIVPNYNAVVAKSNADYFKRFDSVDYKGLNVMFSGKQPKVRPKVLRGAIPLYPNYLYNYTQVNNTYSNLMAMGYFKSARINFTELPDTTRKNYITLIGAGNGVKGAPMNYTREGYLDCDIYCTPALQQGIKAELEASTTSSFYGLKAVVGYQHRNIFRGAEMFEVTGTAGYEYMRAPKSKKRHAMELGLAASLSFPRFLLARHIPRERVIAPKTKFEISYNYQNRPYYRRGLSSVAWVYSWRNRSNSSFVVRPIGINWVDVAEIDNNYFNSLQNQYLKHSFIDQLIVAISGSYVLNKQHKMAPNNYTTLRANCELSGNLLSGISHLFGKPVVNTSGGSNYYELLGIRFSQYARADINASHRIMFGKVTALAARLYAGVAYAYDNSDAVPFDRLFYAGGSNSMRGWAPRTLGPGSSPAPTHVVYPSQLGDMKLEANLEFRFPIWGMFHGATFLDLGNIWYIKHKNVSYPEGSVFEFNNFYKQLAFNTGIGLRLDIKFAILRLDWGIQLHNPNNPEGERWIHNFKWRNTSLNFGVGYPF
ncbi:MAG: BamA/TamA family outer membrane protein [Alistipes sp.]|nr:BamA/TamA family outer membrane protein [Alistipes sp.]